MLVYCYIVSKNDCSAFWNLIGQEKMLGDNKTPLTMNVKGVS